MEVELLTTAANVEDLVLGGITQVYIKIVGTEQGLQMVVRVMKGDEVFDDWKAHMSISYTELVQLRDDMTKGTPNPPYGIPGTGFEVNHWLWKKRTLS